MTKKQEAKESRQLWTGRVRVAFTRPRRRLSGCFDGDEGTGNDVDSREIC